MSNREVIILGTASQVPTKSRNHNALFLRWDNFGFLFDPGEGTQRQMTYAGLAATQITHIVITHFHGDHCLGLAAILQRISLDRVPHPVQVIYPESGQTFFDRLRYASIYHEQAHIIPCPFRSNGIEAVQVATTPIGNLFAYPLEHRVDCFGYRLEEPDSRRMLKEKLDELGIYERAIGELQRKGKLLHQNKVIHLEEVSEFKPGQSFALIMDTRPCANAYRLAHQADLLVSESTYLETEKEEAFDHYHMTAAQAAQIAAQAQVKKLVLTHFSQRYTSLDPFYQEATAFHKEVVVARDLTKVELPKRK